MSKTWNVINDLVDEVMGNKFLEYLIMPIVSLIWGMIIISCAVSIVCWVALGGLYLALYLPELFGMPQGVWWMVIIQLHILWAWLITLYIMGK